MLPPAPDGTCRSMSTGRFAAMVNDARQQSVEEIQPGEEDRAFYRLPVRKRVVVMLGGPTMNLLLAFVLFAIVLVGIGIPQPSMTVADVSLVRADGHPADRRASAVGQLPGGLAAGTGRCRRHQAGRHDRRDRRSADHGLARPPPRGSAPTPGADAVFTVERAGQTVEVPVTIATAVRPAIDEQGNPTSETVTAGFVGIGPEFALGQPAVVGRSDLHVGPHRRSRSRRCSCCP